MKLLRSFPIAAFALVLLSIVGLGIAQHSVALLLVAGALAALSWYVTEGPRGRQLPRWVSMLLVLAVSLNLLVEMTQSRDGWLQALGRFAVWLTLIKLYERKTPKDYTHLLLLSLLLMLIGATQSNELMFGVVLIVYAVLGIHVLVLLQLYGVHEESKLRRIASSPRDYRLVPPVKPIIGRHPIGQFRFLTATIGITGFLLGVFVFVAFPRNLGAEKLSPWQKNRRPGFTESIDLQSGTRITDSRRPVLSLQLLDENGQAMRGPAPLRLRGGVLDVYEGDGRWRSSASSVPPVLIEPDAPVLPGGESTATDALTVVTQVVDLYVPESVLFALATPIEASTADGERLEFNPETHVIRRTGMPAMGRYTVRSQMRDPTPDARSMTAGGSPPLTRHPALENPRVAGLARRALRSRGVSTEPPGVAGSPTRYAWNARAAGALRGHLQSGEFTYVTDLSGVVGAGVGEDPIEHFLFQSQRGHCEYFASAFAALCVNVGIPVRVVTGFVAYEYDQSRARYSVVESNAHAWAEVMVGTGMWRTLDPTPSSALRNQHNIDTTLADRLSWVYQRFEGSWNAGFIAFDRSTQERLAHAVDVQWGERISYAVRATRDWMSRVNRAFYFGPAGYIWMGVVGLAIVLAFLVLIKLSRRTRAIRRTLRLRHVRRVESQRMLRQLGFYVDMLDVLERGGLPKPGWTPPLQYAGRLESTHPEASAIVSDVTVAFYESRYGGQALPRQRLKEITERLDELAALLRVKR